MPCSNPTWSTHGSKVAVIWSTYTGRPAVWVTSGRHSASRGCPTANQLPGPLTRSTIISRTLDGRASPSRCRVTAACCHCVDGTVRSTGSATLPTTVGFGPAAVAYSKISSWPARAPSNGTSRWVPSSVGLCVGSENHGVTSSPVWGPAGTASCQTSVPGAGAGTGNGHLAAAANDPSTIAGPVGTGCTAVSTRTCACSASAHGSPATPWAADIATDQPGYCRSGAHTKTTTVITTRVVDPVSSTARSGVS